MTSISLARLDAAPASKFYSVPGIEQQNLIELGRTTQLADSHVDKSTAIIGPLEKDEHPPTYQKAGDASPMWPRIEK